MRVVWEIDSDGERGIANADWNGSNGFRDNCYGGHPGTMNVLYLDGHVKSLLPTKTMTPLNQWGVFNDTPETATCKQDINCDDISTGALTRLNELQQKYK